MNAYTILVADDHPLTRKGIRAVLEVLNVNHILEAGDGVEALQLAAQHQIDLFILDFKMPRMNGYDAAKSLIHQDPKAKIIVISMFDETALINNLLGLGVQGFLLKNTGIDEIEEGIKKVVAGEIYYDPALHDQVQKEMKMHTRPLTFTPRETGLVQMMSRGKTSKEIAVEWGLTYRTIETYRSRLLEKVNVKNTTELIDYFHKNGLS